MRIFIADDETEVRSALQILLTQESGMSVIGHASQVQGLLKELQMALPDVILLDWELPGRPSLTLLHEIHELSSRPKIIVLSSLPEAERPSLRVGADLFISKGHPPEYLLAALRSLQSQFDMGDSGDD